MILKENVQMNLQSNSQNNLIEKAMLINRRLMRC